jgi:hypothetical protein
MPQEIRFVNECFDIFFMRDINNSCLRFSRASSHRSIFHTPPKCSANTLPWHLSRHCNNNPSQQFSSRHSAVMDTADLKARRARTLTHWLHRASSHTEPKVPALDAVAKTTTAAAPNAKAWHSVFFIFEPIGKSKVGSHKRCIHVITKQRSRKRSWQVVAGDCTVRAVHTHAKTPSLYHSDAV